MRARLIRILEVRRRLRRFSHDTTGAVAIMAALAFPVLVGGMALGAEAGFWYLSQGRIQQAADFVAYAAALQLRSGGSTAEIEAAARYIAEANDFSGDDDDLTVTSLPTTGSRAGKARAVEVVLTRHQTRYFTLIYSTDDVVISARAVVEVSGGGTACMLALDPTARGAISMSGSPQVTLQGCDAATNSSAADALTTSGNPRLTADCLYSVGTVSARSNHLDLKACTAPQTGSAPVQDPYADLPEPLNVGTCAPTSGSQINGVGGSITVPIDETHPNGMKVRRYCGGNGLRINGGGTITFPPGLYIIDGGTFSIGGGVTVRGTGVTFFLNNGARMDFGGGAKIELTAPVVGPLTGVLFYGDRDVAGTLHSYSGGGSQIFNGAIYLPSGDLDWQGSSNLSNGCAQVITRRITFAGASTLNINCSAPGTRPISTGGRNALVE